MLASALALRKYSSSSVTLTSNIFEHRTYALTPSDVTHFTNKVTAAGDLRKSLLPLRLFTMPETGGDLNVASHLYFYPGGMTERDAVRKVSGGNKEWKEFVEDSRRHVSSQRSSIYTEAPGFVLDAAGTAGGADEGGTGDGEDSGIFEVRRYQLVLGYSTVPAFMDHYARGVEAKVKAGQDEGTRLSTVMYNEIGSLNEVIEIWRHSGVGGMERSRKMAREAGAWKEAVGEIAKIAVKFDNAIHRPLPFSPWR